MAQSKLHNFLAQQQRQPALAYEATLQLNFEHDPTPADESAWKADYYRSIFNWAARRICSEFQKSTCRPFWQTTIDECDGKAVAESLGLSVGVVYVVTGLVGQRLGGHCG